MNNTIYLLSDSDSPSTGDIAACIAKQGYIPQPLLSQNLTSLGCESNMLVCINSAQCKSDQTNLELYTRLNIKHVIVYHDREIPQCHPEAVNITKVLWVYGEDHLVEILNQLHTPAEENETVKSEIELKLIGNSICFKEVIRRARQYSMCNAPVLIEGETGTGKELVARAIHYLSERSNAPFIPINCGALPDTLVENELFGHKKGAFTDARQDYPGLVSQAEGGTLFLDEIEALSPKGQVSLLRFLQEKEFRPLGSRALQKSDVRVIAASNACLEQMIDQGDFRKDLWYRLNIMPMSLPPLRVRPTDILPLVEYFMHGYRQRYNSPTKYLSIRTVEWLHKYDWPGNVRELENFIHREFLLAEDDCIEYSQMPSNNTGDITNYEGMVRRFHLPTSTRDILYKFNEAKSRVIESFEKEYLSNIMEQSKGNVSLAAKWAGKERRAFGKLLKKHGLARDLFI